MTAKIEMKNFGEFIFLELFVFVASKVTKFDLFLSIFGATGKPNSRSLPPFFF